MTEFEELVFDMRQAQKEYFKNVRKLGRDSPVTGEWLTKSKMLEKQVDQHLAATQNNSNTQQKLF